jgi:hypothetical protein
MENKSKSFAVFPAEPARAVFVNINANVIQNSAQGLIFEHRGRDPGALQFGPQAVEREGAAPSMMSPLLVCKYRLRTGL